MMKDNIDRNFEFVAEHFYINPDTLYSKHGKGGIKLLKQAIYFYLYHEWDWGVYALSKEFKKNHKTIIHHLSKFGVGSKQYDNYKILYKQVQEAFQNKPKIERPQRKCYSDIRMKDRMFIF